MVIHRPGDSKNGPRSGPDPNPDHIIHLENIRPENPIGIPVKTIQMPMKAGRSPWAPRCLTVFMEDFSQAER